MKSLREGVRPEDRSALDPSVEMDRNDQKGWKRTKQINILKGRGRKCFRRRSDHLGPDLSPRWLPAWGMNCLARGGSGVGLGPDPLPMASSCAALEGSSRLCSSFFICEKGPY